MFKNQLIKFLLEYKDASEQLKEQEKENFIEKHQIREFHDPPRQLQDERVVSKSNKSAGNFLAVINDYEEKLNNQEDAKAYAESLANDSHPAELTKKLKKDLDGDFN